MVEPAHDQALGLRRLFEQRGPAMFSIVGDAGATAVTIDLAAALTRAGRRVLILDRTCGEAASGLGLKARYELAHVLRGEKALQDLVQRGVDGVSVLPAARALAAIDQGDDAAMRALSTLLLATRDRFDVCLVNGLAPRAADGDAAAREVLLVTAPTRVSVTDAYARIKALAPQRTRFRLRVIVNRARNEACAMSIYASLAETARRFLAAQLDYCAYLPPADAAPSRGQAFARLAQSLAAETASSLAIA